MVNFRKIGMSLIVIFFGKVLADCFFIVEDGRCILEDSCNNSGYYIINKSLINYINGESPSCTVENNPKPGFYKNDKSEYIQCKKVEGNIKCLMIEKSIIEKRTVCEENNDGKLITKDNRVQLCTKINELTEDTSGNLEVRPGYETIDFSGENNYIVHYAGEVFIFDEIATNFVVKASPYAIIFNPDFKIGGESNIIDYCANRKGKMMDRKEDFCSGDSSGMYYNCKEGKCIAESQLDGTVEIRGKPVFGSEHSENELDINCNYKSTIENEIKSCYGFYFDSNSKALYKCDGTTCVSNIKTVGYFKNKEYMKDYSVKPYVKCYYESNSISITCEELSSVPSSTTCTPGSLISIDEYNIGLCIDGNITINIFPEYTVSYFIPAELLNKSFNGSEGKYYVLQARRDFSTIKLEFNNEDRHFKYTKYDDYRILEDEPGVCTTNSIINEESDLSEFERDETGNTYKKEVAA